MNKLDHNFFPKLEKLNLHTLKSVHTSNDNIFTFKIVNQSIVCPSVHELSFIALFPD